MKLKYETGIATTIQFVTITFINIIGTLSSSINQCTGGGNNCIGGIVLALLYFLFLTICFGVVWAIGLTAQEKRSGRLSKVLIIFEGFVALFSLYDLTHRDPSIVNRLTSVVGLITAVWIIILAFRLMRAKGGRVRSKSRPRRRPQHQS